MASIEDLPTAAERLSGYVMDFPRVGDSTDGHVMAVAGWVVGRHTTVASIAICLELGADLLSQFGYPNERHGTHDHAASLAPARA